jgi:hypothetical protein
MEWSFVSPMAAGADVAVDEDDEGGGGGGWEVDAAAVEDWEVVVEDRRDADTRLSRASGPRVGAPRLRRS